MMRAAAPGGWPARRTAGGPEIGRLAARRLARRELAEKSWWQSVLDWFDRLSGKAGHAVPHGWFGLIVLAALAALAVVIVIFWVRPGRPGRAKAEPVLPAGARTARAYREAARRHAAAGDFAGAIVDGVRAIAAELEEREILPPRPDRTADELATEAGAQLPRLAAGLRTVVTLFDDVLYGGRAGSQAAYLAVRDADAAVRAARPEPGAAPQLPAGLAAPR